MPRTRRAPRQASSRCSLSKVVAFDNALVADPIAAATVGGGAVTEAREFGPAGLGGARDLADIRARNLANVPSTEITSGSFVFSTPATATSRTANGVSGTFRESSLTYALSRLWSCREAVSHAVT